MPIVLLAYDAFDGSGVIRTDDGQYQLVSRPYGVVANETISQLQLNYFVQNLGYVACARSFSQEKEVWAALDALYDPSAGNAAMEQFDEAEYLEVVGGYADEVIEEMIRDLDVRFFAEDRPAEAKLVAAKLLSLPRISENRIFRTRLQDVLAKANSTLNAAKVKFVRVGRKQNSREKESPIHAADPALPLCQRNKRVKRNEIVKRRVNPLFVKAYLQTVVQEGALKKKARHLAVSRQSSSNANPRRLKRA